MIILSSNNEKKLTDRTYIALGSFDGLHKGHMTLINRVVDEALLNDCKSLVYTFYNHPFTVAAPDRTPKLIMDNEQKLHILRTAGVDIVAMIDFTYEYMQTSAEEFIDILLERYNAKGLVVGFNYKYGFQNLGNVDTLSEMARNKGFELIIMETAVDEGGLISSTRIRKLIEAGHIGDANKLLVEPFMLRGRVVGGRNKGKLIGFPTANMSLDDTILLPKEGVYYTNLELDGVIYRSITSVGDNPTIADGNAVTVETYILDFDREIYGVEIKVYFLEWMREMIKFTSMEELKDQMRKDKNYAVTRKIVNLRSEK